MTADPIKLQQLKNALSMVQFGYLTEQTRSKLINVDPMFNQYCGINTKPLPVERYLIEWTWPIVKVSYKSQVLDKQLDENDLEYLIRSGFYDWISYLISKYFRAEININKRLNLDMLFQKDS